VKKFIGIMGIFVMTAVLAPALANSATTYYVITDLGTLGGSSSWAAGINNSGQVTGWSYIANDNAVHAFLYTEGVGMQDLGTLGGTRSCGFGMDDSGDTAGQSSTADIDITLAFTYSAGAGMQQDGTLGGDSSSSYGINNLGQATGYSYISGFPVPHAFLYTAESGMQDIGTLGGNYSFGIGINNLGQVTGTSGTESNGAAHAFIYDAGKGMNDLGVLGGSGESKGNSINDSEEVTGVSATSDQGVPHAFLFTAKTGMQDIGTLGGSYSEGFSINNSGQITGTSFTTGDAETHAFLYDSGQLTDLNTYLDSTSGWTLNAGKGINDVGQIAGSGLINGKQHAFLMTRHGPPNAPTGVTATPGNGLATVSFTPPASNGGSAITKYTVTSTPGGKTASGPVSPITVTGLKDGTAYTFTATATNQMGTGPASTPSNSIIPAKAPSAPTGVIAKAGNTQATVSFKLGSNGGSPITSCTVTSKPGNLTATGAGSPIIVPGLTNGTAYGFTVKATNNIGTGPPSSYSNRVTPATVPGAPAGVTATPGNAQATVSFTPPDSNGSSIIYYTVTSSTGKTTPGRASPITVRSLTNGTSYWFTVTATNSIGAGPASSASNSVTPSDQ